MTRLRAPRRSPAPGANTRGQLWAMAIFIGALHLLGWGTLIAIVAPQHLRTGTTAFGVGIGATAYALGLRHAFDADHIAAVDSTTRRLLDRGERSVSVGFWFSLGHCTIVFGVTLLIALGARSLSHGLLGDSSVRGTLGVAGTAFSAGFLLLLALMNAGTFTRLWRDLVRERGAGRDPGARQRSAGGLLSRIVERTGRPVEKPWHMYLVGMLFGLGFDTATEIALLVAAGTGSASGLPWYAILCLPVLFAAGMSLIDSRGEVRLRRRRSAGARKRRARTDHRPRCGRPPYFSLAAGFLAPPDALIDRPVESITLRMKSYWACTSRSAISNAESMTSCRREGPSSCGSAGSVLSTLSTKVCTASITARCPSSRDRSTSSESSAVLFTPAPRVEARRRLEAAFARRGDELRRRVLDAAFVGFGFEVACAMPSLPWSKAFELSLAARYADPERPAGAENHTRGTGKSADFASPARSLSAGGVR